MPTPRPSTPICEPKPARPPAKGLRADASADRVVAVLAPLVQVLARHAARELVRSAAGNGNQADGSAPAR